MDDIDPVALQVAQKIAAEMAGNVPQPLDPEDAAARTAYWAMVREREQIERELAQWDAEVREREQQRLAAEQEERSRLERIHQRQRETAERMARESRERASLQAAQEAAERSRRLERAELQRRQQVAQEQQLRQFMALGPLFREQPKPDPVLDKLNEIEAKLEPPEPTLHERLTDPRRFKFDWMP